MIGRYSTMGAYKELFVLRHFQACLLGGFAALAGYLWTIFGTGQYWPALHPPLV